MVISMLVLCFDLCLGKVSTAVITLVCVQLGSLFVFIRVVVYETWLLLVFIDCNFVDLLSCILIQVRLSYILFSLYLIMGVWIFKMMVSINWTRSLCLFDSPYFAYFWLDWVLISRYVLVLRGLLEIRAHIKVRSLIWWCFLHLLVLIGCFLMWVLLEVLGHPRLRMKRWRSNQTPTSR